IGAPLALFAAWPTAVIGAGTLAVTGRWPKRHARMIAAGSMLFACVPMLQMGGFALAGVALILLIGASMVPFRPVHTLAIGIAMEAMYLLQGHPVEEHRFHIAAILVATGLTAVVYRHRGREFASRVEAVRVAEALTGAQLRAELAENAISI